MSETILVSVLMSVYNTEEAWLRQAVESVLNQTMEALEFIIIDDRSSDGSLAVLREYAKKDPRVVLIENETNLGLTKSLNRGLDRARGKYIARMDADDISVPDRLEYQYAYMEDHPEVAVTGGYVFTGSDTPRFLTGCQADMEKTRIRMLFGNAGVAHPTAMIRRQFLLDHGITYNEKLRKSQDYGLWIDIMNKGGCIRTLPRILLRYRVHDGQISAQRGNQMQYARMATGSLLQALVPEYTPEELEFHCQLLSEPPRGDKQQYLDHLEKLRQRNAQRGVYPEKLFHNALKGIWLHLCEYRLRYLKKADFLLSGHTLRCMTAGAWALYYDFFLGNKAACRQAIREYRERQAE